MKAWHFLPANGKICGTNDTAKIGTITQVAGPIIPEKWGLHASNRVLQAVFWAPSLLLTRVELSGIIVEGDRKLAAETRKIIWLGDVTEPFWEWAIERARTALDNENKEGRSVDTALQNALCACIDWRAGKISFEQMLKYRGPARTASRYVLGKDASNKTVRRAGPPGAQTAALCCAQLVEGQMAHQRLAACSPKLENTPARISECDRLEQLITQHSQKGWTRMEDGEPPINAWCYVHLKGHRTSWKGQWTGGGFRGVGVGRDEVVAWQLMRGSTT